MINDAINIFLPHLSLALFVVLLLILSMVVPQKYWKIARHISVLAISVSIILLATVQTEPQYFGFNNSVMSDSYTLLFDFIILVCGFLSALLSKNLLSTLKGNAFTYHAILLSAILGAIMVPSSNDFLTLLISMELLSFSLYFLIGCAKGYGSKEASFKYIITSAVSTGVFLFGVSYLYGITGSINLSDIYEFISKEETSVMYSVSGILIVLGLCAKLAIFPFANWVIDVYKGCETSVLAFLSTVPKLAFFALICRLLVFSLSESLELTFVLAFMSLITAFWANIYAIRETNVKVIFACSTSANASYLLLTASLVSVYNLSTVIFYLICYVFMNIAVFAFLNVYGDYKSFEVESFDGIFYKNYGLVGAYAICILALAGIPLTSGFIAKIYLFTAIANSGLIFVPFLLALLLLMVVALYYYLKILLPLFSRKDKNIEVYKLDAMFSQKFVLVAATAITVSIGLFPEKLIELCRYIAYNI